MFRKFLSAATLSLLLFSSISTSLAAPIPKGSMSKEKAAFYWISGRVTDSYTYATLSSVIIYSQTSHTQAVSDSQGRYSLKIPLSDTFQTLRVQKQGYDLYRTTFSVYGNTTYNIVLSPVSLQLPDLTVSDLSFNISRNGSSIPQTANPSASVTDDVSVSFTIQNIGDVAVKDCFSLSLRDETSDNNFDHAFEYCPSSEAENAMKPGGSMTWTFLIPYDDRYNKLKNPVHEFEAYVDTTDAIVEKNSVNNSKRASLSFFADDVVIIDDLKLSDESDYNEPVTLTWSDPYNTDYDRFEIKYFSRPVESDYNPYEIQYYTMYTESGMLYRVGYLDRENLKDLNSDKNGWYTYTDGKYSKTETSYGTKYQFTLNNPFPIHHQTYVIRFIKKDGTSVYSNALYFYYEEQDSVSAIFPQMADISAPGGPHVLTWASYLPSSVPGHEIDYEVKVYTSTATANPFEISYYTAVTGSGLVYMSGDANQKLMDNFDRFSPIASGIMGRGIPPLDLGILHENTNYVYTISTYSPYSGLTGIMRVVEFNSGSKAASYITRGEFAKLLVESAGYEIDTTGGPHFVDVPTRSPYYEAVETLYNAGIVRGNADGSFRINNFVNRAEATKLFVRTFDLRMIYPDLELPYADVDQTYWYYEYVRILYSNNALEDALYFEGDEAATVSFASEIAEFLNDTRRMVAADLLVDGFDMPLDVTGGPHFEDVPVSHGYYPEIETIYNVGIFHGVNGLYSPDENFTKAETAKLIILASGVPLVTLEEDDIDSECGLPYDVAADDWYTPYLMTLAYYGIDLTDENCDFHPSDNAEFPFFKEVIRALGGSVL